ncbi:MAG: pyridoxine 5'-phosphate synthase [Candidatus Omnitrophica bacterium]|nr:pyridoxine 5'-phosphate synthase [Candidatus Omnitrophota bacterium]
MRLGVNIDHIATVREARGGLFPDPVEALKVAEEAGCDAIVAHLREDRRHINDQDIKRIKENAKALFNMEMSLAHDIIRVALSVKPDEVTFVPERRRELTTEGGLDILACRKRLTGVIRDFKKENITVSLFVEADKNQIEAAKDTGADFIEIHTGSFAEAFKSNDYAEELDMIKNGVDFAISLGLGVNAGHGLDYENVAEIAKITGIESLNIGYSIIARALFVGIKSAVAEMIGLIR